MVYGRKRAPTEKYKSTAADTSLRRPALSIQHICAKARWTLTAKPRVDPAADHINTWLVLGCAPRRDRGDQGFTRMLDERKLAYINPMHDEAGDSVSYRNPVLRDDADTPKTEDSDTNRDTVFLPESMDDHTPYEGQAQSSKADARDVSAWAEVSAHGHDTERSKSDHHSNAAEAHRQALMAAMARQHMLDPLGTFRQRWDIVQAVFLLYIAVVVPYRIGFNDASRPWEFWFCIELFIDMYFIVDLVLNFRTAVFTQDGDLEHNPKLVAIIYLRSWFIIDFVSTVPLSYIEYLPGMDDSEQGRVLKIARLARLLKILRLARIKRILARFEENLYSVTLFSVMKLAVSVAATGHFLACGMFYFGLDAQSDGWVASTGMYEQTHPAHSGLCIEEDCPAPFWEWWNKTLPAENLVHPDDYRYITAFYWAITTVTTIGYGDISASTFNEKVFCIGAMLSGGFIFGMIVASLSDIVTKKSPGDTARANQMGTIKAYMHERKIPPGIARRIQGFYSLNYHTKGTIDDEMMIFRALPENMRVELAQHLQFITDPNGDAPSGKTTGIMSAIPFFAGLGSMDMIAICSKMKYTRVHAAELDENQNPSYFIMEESDVDATEMYVILEGVVHVQRQGKPLGKLRRGGFFGELAVLMPWAGHQYKRSRSAFTLGKTLLAILSHDSLMQLRAESPTIDMKVAQYVKQVLTIHPKLGNGLHGESIMSCEHVVSEQKRLACLEERMTVMFAELGAKLNAIAPRMKKIGV